MTTSTRMVYADTPKELLPICKAVGCIRADIWRRYGGLKTVSKSSNDIRNEISSLSLYSNLPIDGTIRNESTKDIVNDVLLYRAAGQQRVRRAFYTRAKDDEAELTRLYTLLQQGEWTQDNFLHRQMRKHFKHGHSKVNNQFIVRPDKYHTEIVDGKLVVVIEIAAKYGQPIRLVTTTNGKSVDLSGKNITNIVKDDVTEIHYAFKKPLGRPRGTEVIAVDKGYTEAFVDSDGEVHGVGLGEIMTEYSDKASKTGQARNRLYALEKKHREAGRTAKADRIKTNNLGTKKINARKDKAQKQIRNIAFRAAHSVVDKASLVISEDLSRPIAKRRPWKKYNRRMSAWARGTLAEALESTTQQRKARHVLVNAAYTSQMDPNTHLLEGKREADKFYCANGDVLQADFNAALNLLHRYSDQEITLYTPHREVRRILLARSSGATERQGA
ncbi:zinc ribbon domain-containing protein [Ferrimicrobium acidiphilum]|uniref:zinc ribbon domain-containing protein n=1 Tax=Ferrimicrobium acidiphilum TaxID=121039 RepID=UPI0023F35978|nr:zinc ribbon domain-containing protein [Ferrimicrobium acidiphilum]